MFANALNITGVSRTHAKHQQRLTQNAAAGQVGLEYAQENESAANFRRPQIRRTVWPGSGLPALGARSGGAGHKRQRHRRGHHPTALYGDAFHGTHLPATAEDVQNA